MNRMYFGRKLCLVMGLLCLNGVLVAQPPAAPSQHFSGEWGVQLAPGTDVDALADQLGLEVVGRIGSLPDAYRLREANLATDRRSMAQALQPSPLPEFGEALGDGVIAAYPQTFFDLELFAPPDPLYPNQWHLNNTGQSGGTAGQDIRAEGAWNAGYDGTGVVVAIVDNGIEYTHPDLAPNYLAAGSQDFFAGDADPMPDLPTQGHGTATAGLAVGADDGAACGAGVAYNAGLSGIRFLNPVTDTGVANFLSFARDDNDIYSNSWGWTTGLTVGPAFIPFTLAALADNAQNGRGGLGNIYVFAGGNGGSAGENAGRSSFLTTRYTIAVAATNDNGTKTGYSEPGSMILVNAPGGSGDMVTTDMQGVAGFTAGDCNPSFTGTSAAVPVVAGTAALLLDANPALTWRDVQYVLTETATQNDPGDTGWFTNGAGYPFNTAYGFGRVNATNATRLAAAWQTVPAEAPLLTSGIQAVALPVPDNSPAAPLTLPFDFTLPVSQHMVIEHVEVRVNITHPRHGDIAARLISPAGTTVALMTPRPSVFFGDYQNFVWMSVAHRGESPLGRWTLELTDHAAGQTGSLVSWELRITGIPALANDLFMNATDIGTLAAPFFDHARAIQTTRELFDPVPSCANGTAYRTAWYRYNPTRDQPLTVDTRGSAYNTVVSVWTGAPGSFAEVGCDNDGGGFAGLLTNLPVNPGTTYYILVSSYDRSYGNLSFLASTGQTIAAAPPALPAATDPPVIEAAPDLLAQVTVLPATGEIPFWGLLLRGVIGLIVFCGGVWWVRSFLPPRA